MILQPYANNIGIPSGEEKIIANFATQIVIATAELGSTAGFDQKAAEILPSADTSGRESHLSSTGKLQTVELNS